MLHGVYGQTYTAAVQNIKAKSAAAYRGKENTTERKTDQALISKKGLQELKSAGLVKEERANLSAVSMQSMYERFGSRLSAQKDSERFPAEDGEKTDSFDRYANQMAQTYYTLRREIEEKYQDPDRTQEYYAAEDGSIQPLSREKELEMLDQVYQRQSEFMAVSTEIWRNLQDFKPTVVYQSGKRSAAIDNRESVQDVPAAAGRKKTEIAKLAYRALMSAAGSENIGLMSRIQGSLNHVKLDLGISDQDRAQLNAVWDYYANKRR